MNIKDKIKSIYSVWAIAHRIFKGTSCILQDGNLNEPRWRYFCHLAANICGCNGMRLLPWLVWDPVLYGLHDLNNHGYNYMPWEFVNGKFYLDKPNFRWDENLQKMCSIAKEYGLFIIVSVHDRCHGDHFDEKTGKFIRIVETPWNRDFNHQGINRFYNGGKYVDDYEDRLFNVINDMDCYFELINEPRNIDQKTLILFTKRLYGKMIKRGISADKIISGVEFVLNGEVNPVYTGWRKAVDFNDGEEKTNGYAVIHNLRENIKLDMKKPDNERDVVTIQKHSRRTFLSFDGETLGSMDVYKCLLDFFNYVQNREKNKLVINEGTMIEWLYQGINKEGVATSIAGAMGIAEAVKKYFGEYPGKEPGDDYQQDPGLNPPIEQIKPETKSITIISPQKGDTIYIDANNRNLTTAIAWKTTGDIKNVRIEHMHKSSEIWFPLSEKEENDGVYQWNSMKVENGKNYIKIIDYNFKDIFAIQEFDVVHVWQKEKKMNKSFIGKYWRWILGVPLFMAGTLIIVLSPSWLWRLGAFYVNYIVAYFDFVRK